MAGMNGLAPLEVEITTENFPSQSVLDDFCKRLETLKERKNQFIVDYKNRTGIDISCQVTGFRDCVNNYLFEAQGLYDETLLPKGTELLFWNQTHYDRAIQRMNIIEDYLQRMQEDIQFAQDEATDTHDSKHPHYNEAGFKVFIQAETEKYSLQSEKFALSLNASKEPEDVVRLKTRIGNGTEELLSVVNE